MKLYSLKKEVMFDLRAQHFFSNVRNSISVKNTSNFSYIFNRLRLSVVKCKCERCQKNNRNGPLYVNCDKFMPPIFFENVILTKSWRWRQFNKHAFVKCSPTPTRHLRASTWFASENPHYNNFFTYRHLQKAYKIGCFSLKDIKYI